MEAAQQQKAAAAANGGRAASGQPQMRDSPNDNRGGNFFTMSMEFDIIISTSSPALCPTGYQKRTVQILRASHAYGIDNFVAFCFE